MQSLIGIVDYGMGNLGSVRNACDFIGLPARVLSTPEEMDSCRAIILPGVGAFGDCMNHLREHGFDTAVREWINADKPFLGICLGLQVLYESSEESPGICGLGILPGQVRRFSTAAHLKIPQIGWNKVRWTQPSSPLFAGIPTETYFYFVHSYYVPKRDRAEEAATTSYGVEYVSAVCRRRMAAVQFHPEKSQHWGIRLLHNFAQWISTKE